MGGGRCPGLWPASIYIYIYSVVSAAHTPLPSHEPCSALLPVIPSPPDRLSPPSLPLDRLSPRSPPPHFWALESLARGFGAFWGSHEAAENLCFSYGFAKVLQGLAAFWGSQKAAEA